MRTKEQNIQLAQILFPQVNETPEDIFKRYPKRNLKEESMVLRFAPSPTGFIHIGSVFTGLICTKLAKQSNGVSILRIEDTDKEREIKDGVVGIVEGLKNFGIEFDEGMMGEEKEKGNYGPYIQSKRLDIYKVFAKDLVSKGYAYPCFLTEEELEDIRQKQEEQNVKIGCYGKWATWRDASIDSVKGMLEKERGFVIRLYSTGDFNNTFTLNDLVKGNVTIRENDIDAVLLKSDGYPTYHFAHPIDDTLMGITHIIRGDEWYSSTALHVELFEKLSFPLLPYAHVSPLMKMEGDSKRKLSKRKDPESAVSFYIEKGFPKEGILEYLINIANSNFYDWKIANLNSSLDDFQLRIEKLNSSGAIFDIVKLNDICKNYIATLSAEQVYDNVLKWAKDYDKEIEKLLSENREYCIKIFNIEREGEKIRKDLVKWEDSKEYLTIFFNELLKNVKRENISNLVEGGLQKKIVEEYIKVFDINDSLDEWFEKIKKLATELNIEKVGDLAMVLRVAITKKTKTPDLYQIIQVLGKEIVLERLEKYVNLVL